MQHGGCTRSMRTPVYLHGGKFSSTDHHFSICLNGDRGNCLGIFVAQIYVFRM